MWLGEREREREREREERERGEGERRGREILIFEILMPLCCEEIARQRFRVRVMTIFSL
jgi:hypothetical protein